MSMPFDATLKDLARAYAADFLATFDRPPAGPLALLNVDLSTVTTAADLVVGVGDPLAEVVHVDFQSSAAAWKHADVLVYNALLYATYHVPVHSIVILLRPQAAHANLSGVVSYAARSGRGSMAFTYEVVRLWQRPAEELLAGALGTTPLAMLGALPQGVALSDALTAVAQRLIAHLEREASRDQARKLLTAAFVLTGLRVRRDVARQVFRGVRAMRDSDTYLAILEEGEEAKAKAVILRQGEKRFGPPGESVTARLNAITDLDRLDRLIDRLFDATASSWQDLLDTQ
ncbi:MAG TPA: hypothetical protein VJ739_19600 [Gemmataceae bacterium]|nr:hypothetical protein [Gemmataceae bacterium]